MKRKKMALLISVCVMVAIGLAACGKAYSDVDLSKYIKVGKYKGLEVEGFAVTVTPEEVDKEIHERLEKAATVSDVKKGTVADGDTVVITYEGKIDGKSFEGGSAQGASLTIGSGQFIDGFEEGLVGVEVGKPKVLKLKFPQGYTNKDVAGKDTEFTVTVDSKQERILPKLDMDFVKKNSKEKSVEAYKVKVAKDLKAKKEKDEISRQRGDLWYQVVKKSHVVKDKKGVEQYPKEKVERISNKITEGYKANAKEFNMKFSTYLKQVLEIDEKKFKEEVEKLAKEQVLDEEIVYYIAEKEGVEVTSKDQDEYVEKVLADQGYTKETFKELKGKTYEETIGKEDLTTAVYKSKVLDLILKKAKIVKP